MATQLKIGGGEVPYPLPRARALSEAQREILRHARANGTITATLAGRILHAHRGHCGPPTGARSKACCVYCATDGSDALRRLAKRGVVERGPGGWGPS